MDTSRAVLGKDVGTVAKNSMGQETANATGQQAQLLRQRQGLGLVEVIQQPLVRTPTARPLLASTRKIKYHQAIRGHPNRLIASMSKPGQA